MGASQNYGKVVYADKKYVQPSDNSEVLKIFRDKVDNKWYYMNHLGQVFLLFPDGGFTRSIINVDAVNGDDAKAALDKYNQALSFQSLQAAEAAAAIDDTIIVSKGIYDLFSPLTKTDINWYFTPGAKVNSYGGQIGLFLGTGLQQAKVNIQGYGEFFVYSSFARGFAMKYCDAIICGKSFTSLGGTFIGFAYNEYGTYVYNFSEKIDCRSNLGYILQVGDGLGLGVQTNTVINTPIAYFGSFGYWSYGHNVSIVANVLKTVSCDWVGDFTGFAGSHASIDNGASNNQISIFGDLFDIKTVDNTSIINACLNIRAAAGNENKIYIKGNSSVVRNGAALYCDTIENEIHCNTSILNKQGFGILSINGKFWLNGKLTSTVGPVVKGLSGGGDIYLNTGILQSLDASPCIDGTGTALPGTLRYGVYSGGGNIAPAGATNMFAPSDLLVVSPLVQ